jgi:Lipase
MPGCSVLNRFADPLSDSCNHLRAVDYFTESVADPKSFRAVAAESFSDFQKGNVDEKNMEYMGLGCSKK